MNANSNKNLKNNILKYQNMVRSDFEKSLISERDEDFDMRKRKNKNKIDLNKLDHETVKLIYKMQYDLLDFINNLLNKK